MSLLLCIFLPKVLLSRKGFSYTEAVGRSSSHTTGTCISRISSHLCTEESSLQVEGEQVIGHPKLINPPLETCTTLRSDIQRLEELVAKLQAELQCKNKTGEEEE